MTRKLMKITNSIELLDWFKTAIDVDSDYMAAKLLCITTQNVSSVRTGKSEFSELTCLKILLVGDHPEPLETMAIIQAHKAESRGDEEAAKIWRKSVA
ncbi:hypothetical protein [Pseudoalteromonas piscicida]|uniref:Uncharacterized protein n=1 Tax=Pseudoalteromonas piscicida TaxID=43662 RepID=A0AAD0RIH6_PSEO7|nr:hypothetical protein [Pseudoalteromonas piscicida]ASD67044.1 hypothetical protein B1L02_08410 [Pseudoalteromonas piscicida]AXQ97973.1 hypothetical protein D0N37_09550 [Pseudoalteromonas piscicida]AXR02249.1 hypothetical protein D0511_09360 [Pseudoalteromonas piscicida]